ncbi:uncharacterized protein [Spinacia oleracea]|uniref:Uncharacterized protein isoform X2 n=1 Tax=Spinacia oleracea TaxID=3562 RepID=A0ABM3QL90_SPIOL|nr:uncharacterized protein LOC110789487 isoform X2 [Spinacia oleracea]
MENIKNNPVEGSSAISTYGRCNSCKVPSKVDIQLVIQDWCRWIWRSLLRIAQRRATIKKMDMQASRELQVLTRVHHLHLAKLARKEMRDHEAFLKSFEVS